MSVRVPQLAVPFRVIGGDLAVVEQGSQQDIEQNVEAVLRTFVGSRMEDAPDFGIPDETFHQLGPNESPEVYLAAVERAEPRARLLGERHLEELVDRIVIRPAEAAGV